MKFWASVAAIRDGWRFSDENEDIENLVDA